MAHGKHFDNVSLNVDEKVQATRGRNCNIITITFATATATPMDMTLSVVAL